MKHTIPFGADSVSFTMFAGEFAGTLEPPAAPPESDLTRMTLRALRNPIGTSSLREIAKGKQTAVILIPGKARRVGTEVYVPLLIEELTAAGLSTENIQIVLADGTHEQHLENDIADLLGPELAGRVTHWGHDPRKDEDLRELGITSAGTPVLFNRRVLDTDVKILTGRIVPHYFAGFSGGRKALLPGVAGFRTILANHRLTLDPQAGIHAAVRPCSLNGNPVHRDMVEAVMLAKPEFCLNTLLDASHGCLDVVAGDTWAAHEEGCRRARRLFHATVAKPVDVLITSAGGLPYDSNFMQSLKAIFNPQPIVKPGGSILWVAECRGGIHPGFLRWAAIKSDQEMDAAIRAAYALTGHNSLMLRALIRKCRVALLSRLPPDTVRELGLHAVTTIEEGLEWIRKNAPAAFRYAVVPHANAISAEVGPGEMAA